MPENIEVLSVSVWRQRTLKLCR